MCSQQVQHLQLANPCYRVRRKHVARFYDPNKETQSFTISNPRFAGSVQTANLPSFGAQGYPQIFMVGQPTNHISDLQFKKKNLTPATFQCWKTNFKTEVCAGSNHPSESMRWMKEVEMTTSLDDLETSRSFIGNPFPKLRDACPICYIAGHMSPQKR